MASPRVIISTLKSISPRPAQKSLRLTLSPKTPIKNTLNFEKTENIKYASIRLSPFSIDTPNRTKILNDGLPDQTRTVLGSGCFGVVYEASYKGDQVAAKIVKPKKGSDSAVKAEKRAAFLRHSNIVKVLGVEEGLALSLITMELCGTTLQDRLEENALAGKERIGIWKGIARALQFCHRAGVVHADVKPKNILIAANGQPKLADFGSSVLLNERQPSFKLHVTPGYAAPEVVRGECPDTAADVYSLGIVAWQMLSRIAPYAGLHVHTILYLTGKGARPSDDGVDDGFDGEYQKLYRAMWSENKQDRPSLDRVIDDLVNIENKCFRN